MANYRQWFWVGLCGLLALPCAGAARDSASTAMPRAEYAASEAPYAVGSSTLFIHDPSRPFDSVAGVDTGVRSLITEIWYPIDRSIAASPPPQLRRATYGDYVFGNRDVHRRMMTETTFFHLTPETVSPGVTQTDIDTAIDELFTRQRRSWVDAPVAPGPQALPVVVMTHGDAGSRYNMETVCEYLAAHGYMVIAPEHTGNSPFAMTGSDPALAAEGGDPDFKSAMAGVLPLLDEHGVYGKRENYGQTYSPLSSPDDPLAALQKLDRSLVQRVGDLRATLDELERMNSAGKFRGRLALDRVGLVGRSFGGTTTLVALALEQRFTSGFAVVPLAVADQRSQLPPELLVPAGQESALLAAEGPSPFVELAKPTVLLSGAEDALIINAGREQARMAGTELPSPKNPHPALRQSFKDSRQPVIWGLLADSNHATLGVSGSYWWPELKPDTARRAFDPDTSFKLIDPTLAHRIQREKALAFFDLTLRGDEAAGKALLDGGYADRGLTLEARNLRDD